MENKMSHTATKLVGAILIDKVEVREVTELSNNLAQVLLVVYTHIEVEIHNFNRAYDICSSRAMFTFDPKYFKTCKLDDDVVWSSIETELCNIVRRSVEGTYEGIVANSNNVADSIQEPLAKIINIIKNNIGGGKEA